MNVTHLEPGSKTPWFNRLIDETVTPSLVSSLGWYTFTRNPLAFGGAITHTHLSLGAYNELGLYTICPFLTVNVSPHSITWMLKN